MHDLQHVLFVEFFTRRFKSGEHQVRLLGGKSRSFISIGKKLGNFFTKICGSYLRNVLDLQVGKRHLFRNNAFHFTPFDQPDKTCGNLYPCNVSIFIAAAACVKVARPDFPE